MKSVPEAALPPSGPGGRRLPSSRKPLLREPRDSGEPAAGPRPHAAAVCACSLLAVPTQGPEGTQALPAVLSPGARPPGTCSRQDPRGVRPRPLLSEADPALGCFVPISAGPGRCRAQRPCSADTGSPHDRSVRVLRGAVDGGGSDGRLRPRGLRRPSAGDGPWDTPPWHRAEAVSLSHSWKPGAMEHTRVRDELAGCTCGTLLAGRELPKQPPRLRHLPAGGGVSVPPLGSRLLVPMVRVATCLGLRGAVPGAAASPRGTLWSVFP